MSQLWTDAVKPQVPEELFTNSAAFLALADWLGTFLEPVPVPRPILLSGGGHGTGKTLLANLVCQQFGFRTVEINATDDRTKVWLQASIEEIITSHPITNFPGFSTVRQRTCLILDELDVGLPIGAELTILVMLQMRRIPIICICDQTFSPLTRRLAPYCQEIRLPEPSPPSHSLTTRLQQRLAALSDPNWHISTSLIEQWLGEAKGDVRYLLLALQFWCRPGPTSGLSPQISAKDNLPLGHFQTLRRLFEAPSLPEKLRLAGEEPLVPLLLQENYLAAGELRPPLSLDRLAEAAEAISLGDVMDCNLQAGESVGCSMRQLLLLQAVVRPLVLLGPGRTPSLAFPTLLGHQALLRKRLLELNQIRRLRLGLGLLAANKRQMLFVP